MKIRITNIKINLNLNTRRKIQTIDKHTRQYTKTHRKLIKLKKKFFAFKQAIIIFFYYFLFSNDCFFQ